MIGVIPKAGQEAVVAEFFELFKTPWELYRPDGIYDVVLATATEVPDIKPALLVVYGADVASTDAREGITARARHSGAVLDYDRTGLPIYGELLTFAVGENATVCLTGASGVAGVRAGATNAVTIRVGYDLFEELRRLLAAGQPVERAHIPTLDLHIELLRKWIVQAGIPLLEIPPTPASHSFIACLTHDIDFVGIRMHRFDHSMWGFLFRATIGALRDFFRSRITAARLLENWRSAAALPLVHLGLAKDFWEPFDWYLRVEKGLPATYFFIPFKGRAGEHVSGSKAPRRAAAYDIADLPASVATLLQSGCEVGVHGIDAWHSVAKGRNELDRIRAATGQPSAGIRMHWLLQDANTASVLEEAGYRYDSTVGYNETVGYRAGTAQVFRPLGVQTLLELPMHIQDGALFYRDRLDLAEAEAWNRCQPLIDNARERGGVLTALWHDRSHAPERFWGDFYVRLVERLKSLNAWFGSAMDVVAWFRKRRGVRFERTDNGAGLRLELRHDGDESTPPLNVRIHRPGSGAADIPWDGAATLSFDLSGTYSCQ